MEGEDDDVEQQPASSGIRDYTNFVIIAKNDDAQVIKDIIGLEKVDIAAWLGGLNLEAAEAFLASIDKYKKSALMTRL